MQSILHLVRRTVQKECAIATQCQALREKFVLQRTVRRPVDIGVRGREGRTHLVAINISSDEETLALGYTPESTWLVRACWYVFRIREHAAAQEIPSFTTSFLPRSLAYTPLSLGPACAESVHEILRVRSLPQGAAFTTNLQTYADSGPSGTATSGGRTIL